MATFDKVSKSGLGEERGDCGERATEGEGETDLSIDSPNVWSEWRTELEGIYVWEGFNGWVSGDGWVSHSFFLNLSQGALVR